MNKPQQQPNHRWEKLFWGIILTGIPLIFIPTLIDPLMLSRFLMLTGILLLAIIVFLLANFRKKSSFDFAILRYRIFLLFALYGVFSILSIIHAVNPSEAVFEISKIFLKLIFWIVATALLVRKPSGVRTITRSITLGAGILAIMAIAQYFDIAFTSFPGKYVLKATMVNKNLLATFLALSVPFLLYGIVNTKGYWSVLSMAALMSAGFVISISQTRSSWVAVVGSLLLTTLFVLKYRKAVKLPARLITFYKKRLFYVANILLIVIALSVVAHTTYTREHQVLQKELTGAFLKTASIDIRMALWKKTLSMIADHPLLGVGAGNWKIHIPAYGMEGLPSESGKLNYVRPHNDFLWVFSETGIMGFLAFLSIFAIQFYYLYRLLFHTSDPTNKLLAVLMGWGLVSYLLIAFFSFPGERIAHSVYLLTMMAIITMLYHQHFPVKAVMRHRAVNALAFVVSVSLLFSMYVGWVRMESELYTKKGLQAQNRHHWAESIPELTKAISPFANMHPAGTPIIFYRGLAHAHLDSIRNALQDFQSAEKVHPYHILVKNNLAAAYQRTGDSEHAIAVLQDALEIAPHMEDVLLNLTAIYYRTGNYTKAYETIRRCNPNSRNPKVRQFRQAIEKKLK